MTRLLRLAAFAVIVGFLARRRPRPRYRWRSLAQPDNANPGGDNATRVLWFRADDDGIQPPDPGLRW